MYLCLRFQIYLIEGVDYMAGSDSVALAVKREIDALVCAGHTGSISATIQMLNGTILKASLSSDKVLYKAEKRAN